MKKNFVVTLVKVLLQVSPSWLTELNFQPCSLNLFMTRRVGGDLRSSVCYAIRIRPSMAKMENPSICQSPTTQCSMPKGINQYVSYLILCIHFKNDVIIFSNLFAFNNFRKNIRHISLISWLHGKKKMPSPKLSLLAGTKRKKWYKVNLIITSLTQAPLNLNKSELKGNLTERYW